MTSTNVPHCCYYCRHVHLLWPGAPVETRKLGPCPGESWGQCLVSCHHIHDGDETLENIAQTPGPHLSWNKTGAPTAIEPTLVQRGVQFPSWGLPPAPALLPASLGPSGLPHTPSGKAGVAVQSSTSGNAAPTCQVHESPAGDLKTSWKETNDWVSSTSIYTHLKAMIPTLHLTVIFQLIVT